MKTIKLSLFVLTVIFIGTLSSSQAFAKKPATDKPAYVEQLNKIVKETVKYPEFSLNKEESGDITVTFSLTDHGMISVENINAPSERIEQYVREQLKDVSCKDVIHPYGQKYKVTFKFQNS